MDSQKKSTGLSSAFRSASDSSLATNTSGGFASRHSESDSRFEQSQPALSPPTPSRRNRFLNKLGWKSSVSSRLPSPSPKVDPRNTITTDHHHIPTPSLTVLPNAPHGSHSAHEPLIAGGDVTAGGNVPAVPSVEIDAKLPPDEDTPPHSSMVWPKALEIAKEKLSVNNLPPLNLPSLTSQSAEENIEAVVQSLNDLQEDEQTKRWSYTWRGKKVIIVERLGEILRSIEKYSKVVDTAIQCYPQVSTLVWAGIQAIMRVRILHTMYYIGRNYTDSMAGRVEPCGSY